MKLNIFNLLSASVILLGAASCNEEAWTNVPEEGNGKVELRSMVINLNEAEKVIRRMPTRADHDISNFNITVTDANSGLVVGKWKYADMPEVITLPVGDNYLIDVESHEEQKAEWDNPYFHGSESFAIEKGKITSIGEVVAKFESLKVTIVFGEDLLKIMGDDAKVTVKGSNGAELVYVPSEKRSGYFAVDGAITFAAHFEGSIGGVTTVDATPFKNIEKGQHHIITYSVKSGPEIPEQSGKVDPSDVELDKNYQIEDVDSNTVVDEDLIDSSDRPGQEEADDPNQGDNQNPTPGPGDDENPDDNAIVKFEAYDSPDLDPYGLNNAEGYQGNAIVRITCKNGIEKFDVKISSDDKEGFGQAIDDLGLTEFDLINPAPNQKNSLAELKLPYGEDVKDKNEVLFNITEFVPLLLAYQFQYDTDHIHTFTMIVKDKGESEPYTLNLRFLVKTKQ